METSILGRPTFGGLASGLDTSALLNGLLELERLPLNRIQTRRSQIDQQRGLMRDLNTKLVALRKASQALDNRNDRDTGVSLQEEFLRYKGSSTNEDVVTVSAGFGATPGNIPVVVDKLAKGSQFFSVSFASDTVPVLTPGQSVSMTLDDEDLTAVPPVEQTQVAVTADLGGGGLTLRDIRDSINTNENNGGKIRADVLKISDNEFQLVLSSTGTGTSNQLFLGGNLAFQGPASTSPEDVAAFLEKTGASNAQFRLFGSDQVLERESNVVDDALTGITLRLTATSELRDGYDPENPAQVLSDFQIPETVSVDVDVEEVAKGLEAFTKAYNDVVNFIDRQFRFDEGSNTSGPLAGDSTLRSVQSQLRSMVSTGFSFSTNQSNPFAPSSGGARGGSISGIGLEIIDGGLLRLDKEKLEEALALDPTSVREFLSGRARNSPANPEEVAGNPPAEPDLYDEGFAQLVSTQLEQLVRSGDGTLASRDEAFAKRLKEFDLSIERFEFRLGQREETLIQRFASLERIVSGLQSQQGFLASGLG